MLKHDLGLFSSLLAFPYTIAGMFSLGLAYAGNARGDVNEYLVPLIVDSSQNIQVFHDFR